MLSLPGVVTEPEYPKRSASGSTADLDRVSTSLTQDTLARCNFDMIFTDSKFLKQGGCVG